MPNSELGGRLLLLRLSVICLALVTLLTTCGQGENSTDAVKTIPATSLVDAADAVVRSETGRFESRFSIEGMPDFPSGVLYTTSGSYDVRSGLIELRMRFGDVVADFIPDDLLRTGTTGPHLILVADEQYFYLRMMFGPDAGKWHRFAQDKFFARAGIYLPVSSEGLASVFPDALRAVRSAEGRAEAVGHATLGQDRIDLYRVAVKSRTLSFAMPGVMLRTLLARLDWKTLKQLFTGRSYVVVGIDKQGLARQVNVDLSRFFYRALLEIVPLYLSDDLKDIEEDLSVKSEWTFHDGGEPIDIKVPNVQMSSEAGATDLP